MGDELTRLTDTLEELLELLRSCGEDHWCAWIARDLERIRGGDAQGLQHLLSAYGGMGSFGDLLLCPENGHRVNAAEVESVNARLRRLASRAHDLAWQLERGVSPVGRPD